MKEAKKKDTQTRNDPKKDKVKESPAKSPGGQSDSDIESKWPCSSPKLHLSLH